MPGRKYLYTERAHYMSPNMHFGIMAEIGSEFDADGIIESIGVLRSAHPLMRSLIAEEEAGSLYHEPWKSREQHYKRGCIHSAGISRKQEGVGRSDDKQ